MKLRLIAGAIAAFGSIGIAQAADLPVRRAPAPVPVVAPVYNWSGFYIGGNVGYGWSAGTVDINGVSFEGGDLKGPFAGGQIGYNWQAGQWVFGIEADGQWANIKEDYTFAGLTFTDKVDYFFTIRGRLGIAFNNALLYATGGYAHLGWESSVTDGATIVSVSGDRGGWTVGGGMEFAFASNWSAKLEYLYIQTFDKDQTIFNVPVTWNLHVHTAKVGLNYRFGGGGPVVARY
jgi:outer membrane immunogenic protein